MPQYRNYQVISSIERDFYDALQEVLGEENCSASSYLRVLIINDLIKRGKVTENVLVRIVRG